jgi:hypothetical protein
MAWMKSSPFSRDEVEAFNTFSHFYVDINKEFNDTVEHKEDEIRNILNRYGVKQFTNEIKTALYYYRKALYQYYLDESRARSVAPPISVVGPTKYRGNVKLAESIHEKALQKIRIAEDYLNKAVNRAIAGRIPEGVKTNILFSEISGAKLKKDLNLKNAIKGFHNKHRDGSGNFGFVLITKDDKHYQVAGDYATDGTVYNLVAGTYGGGLDKVEAKSYDELINKLKNIVNKS